MKDTAESILNSYNRDNSDSQSDYFDVDFYGHVVFEADIVRSEHALAAALGDLADVLESPRPAGGAAARQPAAPLLLF